MLAKSVFCGWRWAVFSPESFPADEFYDTIIHALVGKTPDPIYAGQMSRAQYEEAASFINSHFFFIHPDGAHTIEEVEANVRFCQNEYGIDGVLIDPFNQLERDFSLRDDQYLEKFIIKRKRFANDNQVNYLCVVHPKQMDMNKEGEYNPVNAYDMANGAMWINKTDNFISIDRPRQVKSPADTSVDVHVKKIKKQKLVGIPGTVFWDFRRTTNRYYSDGFSPLSSINSDAPGKSGTNFTIESRANAGNDNLTLAPPADAPF